MDVYVYLTAGPYVPPAGDLCGHRDVPGGVVRCCLAHFGCVVERVCEPCTGELCRVVACQYRRAGTPSSLSKTKKYCACCLYRACCDIRAGRHTVLLLFGNHTIHPRPVPPSYY